MMRIPPFNQAPQPSPIPSAQRFRGIPLACWLQHLGKVVAERAQQTEPATKNKDVTMTTTSWCHSPSGMEEKKLINEGSLFFFWKHKDSFL